MINSVSNRANLSQLLQSSGAQNRLQEVSGRLSNAEGKSLSQFQEQLRSVATSTLEAGGGREDVMAAVQGFLDENGFDSGEVFSTLRGLRGQTSGSLTDRLATGLIFDGEA
ncbi:MAG: hypothetical protein AAFX94_09895 [Myxococcota bacterium]